MKRIKLKWMMLLLLTVTLVGCGVRRESAEKAVTNALTAVKNLDEPTISRYFGSDVITEQPQSESESISSNEMMALYMKNLSFNLVNSDELDQAATVNVEITNMNMEKVLAQFFTDALAYSFSYAFLPETEQPSVTEVEAKYNEMMNEIINNGNIELVSNTVEVHLAYETDQWKIDANDKLLNAIYGGMLAYFNEKVEQQTETSETDTILEIRNWVVDDIWNNGFNHIASYLLNGKSASEETMDIELTLSQLEVALQKKPDYETFMSGLSDDYTELKQAWVQLSHQIDELYIKVKAIDFTQAGQSLDTSLFKQDLEAFDDAYFSLK